MDRRQWRTFGILLASFTLFCLVMFCGFHYTSTFSFRHYPHSIR